MDIGSVCLGQNNSSEADAPRQRLFGVPVAAITMDEALAIIDESIAQNSRLRIGVVNVAKVVNMHRDSTLRESVEASDIVFADGMGIVWASRVLGHPLPERITGIDLMLGILARGTQTGLRVFCLGASEDVSLKVTSIINSRYPGVQLVGRRNGYFGEDEEGEVAEDVRKASPDVLFIAITSPKKENFMARWGGHMGVPVVHGVGGSFDVMAGKVSRAPIAIQRLGLEWLYRVAQEPGRLWKRYLVTNVLFVGLVAREFVKRGS